MNEKSASGDDAAVQALRRRIDEIDVQVQSLISQRARCAQQIGAAKGLRTSVDYYRPEREAQVPGRRRAQPGPAARRADRAAVSGN